MNTKQSTTDFKQERDSEMNQEKRTDIAILEDGSSRRVLAHRVLIQIEIPKDGVIVVPETVKEQQQNRASEGIVLAYGPSAWKEYGTGHPQCTIGEKVSFPRHSGQLIPERPELRILDDENILEVLG